MFQVDVIQHGDPHVEFEQDGEHNKDPYEDKNGDNDKNTNEGDDDTNEREGNNDGGKGVDMKKESWMGDLKH